MLRFECMPLEFFRCTVVLLMRTECGGGGGGGEFTLQFSKATMKRAKNHFSPPPPPPLLKKYIKLARETLFASSLNEFLLNQFMYVKAMLPEPLDLFHMLLKFPENILTEKLPLSSFIFWITQNKSFSNFLIIL